MLKRIASFISASALAKIGWGIWLLLFNVFASSHSYDAMAHFADEELWGVFMLLIGLLQFYFIIFVRINIPAIKLMQYISFGIWIYIATMVTIANYQSTGVPAYFVLAVIEGLNLFIGEENND